MCLGTSHHIGPLRAFASPNLKLYLYMSINNQLHGNQCINYMNYVDDVKEGFSKSQRKIEREQELMPLGY
ncbi:hypothetical protein L2E82_13362 [Cichorium intybus]|uniref:Uncharacterized protein n=1 Tax=Cichorium intybus TaxID=13427 RepID=A0ACB9EXX1_CICIN|nr:hypothetical protein L2E82_13362 [Cichorium intybus]